MSLTKPPVVAELVDLVGVMRRADGFAEVREALLRGESAAIDGAWGSACALAAAALVRDIASQRRASEAGDATPPTAEPVLLVVLPRISEVDDYAVDMAGFLGRPPEILPAWEALPREQKATDPVLTGRMRVLRALDQVAAKSDSQAAPEAEPPRRAIVTS